MLILGIFFLIGFFIFVLLQICQYYVYFGEFLVMSILWDGDQKGLASLHLVSVSFWTNVSRIKNF